MDARRRLAEDVGSEERYVRQLTDEIAQATAAGLSKSEINALKTRKTDSVNRLARMRDRLAEHDRGER